MEPSSPPLLQAKGIAVTRQGHTVFQQMDFNLYGGQQWAVIGDPERDKRLFLEALAGKTQLKQGAIHHHYAEEYLNQSVNDGRYRSHYDLVCFVPFHHHFRNRSNVQDFYYQQRYNSMDADDVATVEEYLRDITPKVPATVWRVEKAMALFDLTAFADKSLIKLSNGETRRLMLASALVRNPKILLLENPLTGLDIDTRARFNAILKQITDSGIQVVMTTTPGEIPAAITHVAVIEKGRITQQGERNNVSLPEPAAANASLPHHLQPRLAGLLSKHEKPTGSPVVEMKRVTVRYGNNTVLQNINWRVEPGEAWVLRGHNGAGKSTLLSLVNGDNPQAYKNDISLFGRKRGTGESIWDIKKNIGYVSPELHQYFPKNQTAIQVVLSGFFDTIGLFRKVTAPQRDTALQWMALFDVADVAHQRLTQLGADQQRLCLLARAVIKNPVLLILDEPCQGLAPEHRGFFKTLVNAIYEINHTTIIYVSHYEADIPSCVSKTITLTRGKVDQE